MGSKVHYEDFRSGFAAEMIQGENSYFDMKGAVLNISVAVLDFQRYSTHAVVDSSGEIKLYPSLSYELFAVLQMGMNFTPNFKASDHWGLYDSQKSEWSGMIGQLVRNVTDLALSGTTDSPQRRTAVDFNIDFNELHFIALYRPPDLNQDKFALLRPFSSLVWLAIGGFIISLILALFLVSTVHRRYGGLDTNELTGFSTNQLLDGIFWAGRILCFKGIHQLPQTGSIRLLVLVGYFAAVLLNVAYTGTLVSFVVVATGGFTRFEQLLRASFIFDTRSNATLQVLQVSSSPSVQEAVGRVRYKAAPTEVFQARKKLLQGSFVYIAYAYTAYEALTKNFSVQDHCLINDLALPMQSFKIGTMVRKGSPLKRIIDYQIVKAKQLGLNNCWLKRYTPQRPLCLIWSGAGNNGVQFKVVLVAMYILISGVVSSFVILVVEIISNSSLC